MGEPDALAWGVLQGCEFCCWGLEEVGCTRGATMRRADEKDAAYLEGQERMHISLSVNPDGFWKMGESQADSGVQSRA